MVACACILLASTAKPLTPIEQPIVYARFHMDGYRVDYPLNTIESVDLHGTPILMVGGMISGPSYQSVFTVFHCDGIELGRTYVYFTARPLRLRYAISGRSRDAYQILRERITRGRREEL